MNSHSDASTTAIAETTSFEDDKSKYDSDKLSRPKLTRFQRNDAYEDNGWLSEDDFRSDFYSKHNKICKHRNCIEIETMDGITYKVTICNCIDSNSYLHKRFNIRMALCEIAGFFPDKISLFQISENKWCVIQLGDQEKTTQITYMHVGLILECTDSFYEYIKYNNTQINWLLISQIPNIESETNIKFLKSNESI